MTTTLDPNTAALLRHQHGRLHKALHETKPPDRKAAEGIQKVIDNILDHRLKPIAVAADGEAIWPGASPWVLDQASPMPSGMTTVKNNTDRPEPVLTAEQLAELERGRRELGL